MLRMMLDDIDRLGAFIDDILEASRIRHGRSDRRHRGARRGGHRAVRHVRTRYQLEASELEVLRAHRTRARHGSHQPGSRAEKSARQRSEVQRPPGGGAAGCTPARRRSSPHRSGRSRDWDSARTHRADFERFYRVPEEDVASRRGTGLACMWRLRWCETWGGSCRWHPRVRGRAPRCDSSHRARPTFRVPK